MKGLQKTTQPTAQVLPDDLAEVVGHWTKLPESMRAGIVAMARAFCDSMEGSAKAT
jgi:hypothetical protein